MNKPSGLAVCVALALAVPISGETDEQREAWAKAGFEHTDRPLWEAGDPTGGPPNHWDYFHPLDEPSWLALPLPLDESSTEPWDRGRLLGDSYGLDVYANATGRVRTGVKTGIEQVPDPSFPPSKHGYVQLLWQGKFTRTSTTNPTFTINPSWLELRAQLPGAGVLRDLEGRMNPEREVVAPFSSMYFAVVVFNEVAGDGPSDVFPSIRHQSKLSGIVFNILDPGISVNAQTPIRVDYIDTDGDDRDPDTGMSRWLVDRDGNQAHTLPVEETVLRGDPFCVTPPGDGEEYCSPGSGVQVGLRLDIGPYTGGLPLDLWGIEQGDRYTVRYILAVEAGEDSEEHFAEAFLGDPLDADGDGEPDGFSLETEDEPYAAASQRCDVAPDRSRFVNHGDGTVTDTKTGLMWQRCPLGMTLDENGTPSDLIDDLCTLNVSAEFDWRTSLELARSDAHAGYDDWRVPNLKALESLVLPECPRATIDDQAFPDTPSRLFWSSTPAARLSGTSWVVDFGAGTIRASGRANNSSARLVRNSGQAPVELRPNLAVARTSVMESDSGETAQLRFPVTLSSATPDDVTAAYVVNAVSAAESQDYLPAAGTLTIPAGAVSAEIVVTVQGDDDPEPPEHLTLTLHGVSGNAHLSVASALGTILDDEPVISFDDVEHRERDVGTGEMNFVLRLNRPATLPVSVDYATADGGAVAGDDYIAVSGTATFATGEDRLVIPVPINGDGLPENDDVVLLELGNAVGAHFALDQRVIRGEITDDDTPRMVMGLNDTGITHCATGTGTGLVCPQAGFEPQDGDVGRDVTETDQDDGVDGFSFTKLSAAGDELPFDARQWACVRDDVTGLVWEAKSGVSGSLHDADATYSWYDNSGIDDGGDAGTPAAGQCSGIASCDTQSFVEATNAEQLCGFDDWRLPAVEESWSLANMNPYSNLVFRGIDALYFPNTNSFDSAYYWTGTPLASDGSQAWVMHFETPEPRIRVTSKQNDAFVRLVRGGGTLR